MRILLKTGLLAYYLIILPSTTFAVNYVGIIMDGYQENCTVKSEGEDYNCTEIRQLYVNDIVIKEPNLSHLKIKWAPYASGENIDKKTMKVVFMPPKDRSIIKKLTEFLELVKTKRKITVGATRSKTGTEALPQPNDNATVMTGQKVKFVSASQKDNYLVFRNNSGKEIFRKETGGLAYVYLTPGEIGMEAGKVYTWVSKGSEEAYKIRLLNNDTAQQVTAALEKIESEHKEIVSKEIRRAAFLQFLSDTYPVDIDLYWLSFQIIESIDNNKNLSNEAKILSEELKRNYIRHADQ